MSNSCSPMGGQGCFILSKRVGPEPSPALTGTLSRWARGSGQFPLPGGEGLGEGAFREMTAALWAGAGWALIFPPISKRGCSQEPCGKVDSASDWIRSSRGVQIDRESILCVSRNPNPSLSSFRYGVRRLRSRVGKAAII